MAVKGHFGHSTEITIANHDLAQHHNHQTNKVMKTSINQYPTESKNLEFLTIIRDSKRFRSMEQTFYLQ